MRTGRRLSLFALGLIGLNGAFFTACSGGDDSSAPLSDGGHATDGTATGDGPGTLREGGKDGSVPKDAAAVDATTPKDAAAKDGGKDVSTDVVILGDGGCRALQSACDSPTNCCNQAQ